MGFSNKLLHKLHDNNLRSISVNVIDDSGQLTIELSGPAWDLNRARKTLDDFNAIPIVTKPTPVQHASDQSGNILAQSVDLSSEKI